MSETKEIMEKKNRSFAGQKLTVFLPLTFKRSITSVDTLIFLHAPKTGVSEDLVEITHNHSHLSRHHPQHIADVSVERRLKPYWDYLSDENIWLRPRIPADYPHVKAIYRNPENVKYLGDGKIWPFSVIKKRIRESSYTNLKGCRTSVWTIFAHGGVVGSFAAYQISPNTLELSYAIHPEFSGRKMTTQAGKLVMNYIVESMFQGTIMATAHPKNLESQAVLTKLGLKPIPEKQNVWVPAYNAPRHYYQMSVKEDDSLDNVHLRHPRKTSKF